MLFFFNVLYLFHCSVDGVESYFDGEGGSGGVSGWFRPLPLISQSGEQRVLKLHNNLLSSSGGSVYLTKSSQGCRILFCVLLSLLLFLCHFMIIFFLNPPAAFFFSFL